MPTKIKPEHALCLLLLSGRYDLIDYQALRALKVLDSNQDLLQDHNMSRAIMHLIKGLSETSPDPVQVAEPIMEWTARYCNAVK